MDFMSLSQRCSRFILVLKNKSSMITKYDLKMIWWLVLFLQDLCRSFNFNILFPKHDNLKVSFLYVTCTI